MRCPEIKIDCEHFLKRSGSDKDKSVIPEPVVEKRYRMGMTVCPDPVMKMCRTDVMSRFRTWATLWALLARTHTA